MTDETPFLYNPYRQMRGFRTPNDEWHKKNCEKRMENISNFHYYMRAFFEEVKNFSESMEISIKESKTGDGIFNGPRSIECGKQFAYFIGTIFTVLYDNKQTAKGDGDRSYTWQEEWMGRDCVCPMTKFTKSKSITFYKS